MDAANISVFNNLGHTIASCPPAPPQLTSARLPLPAPLPGRPAIFPIRSAARPASLTRESLDEDDPRDRPVLRFGRRCRQLVVLIPAREVWQPGS